jgi:hypothetical protein
MSVVVSGSLMLSNGQSPSYHLETSAMHARSESGEELICQCKVVGKHIFLEFSKGFQQENVSEELIDQIFRTSRHLVDTVILTIAGYEGIGLIYTLELCILSTDQCIYAPIDFISQNEEAKLNYQDFFMAAQIPEVR